SYIDDVLSHRRDEATVMGPPTDTMSVPVVSDADAPATGEVPTTDTANVDWRDLV
ncbi:MAG: DUF4032 domain-containing protein, partial [Actinobacteria bacterium]|nr:DUF4032 domain-containing protein [Actinomycetota bacterium]